MNNYDVFKLVICIKIETTLIEFGNYPKLEQEQKEQDFNRMKRWAKTMVIFSGKKNVKACTRVKKIKRTQLESTEWGKQV